MYNVYLIVILKLNRYTQISHLQRLQRFTGASGQQWQSRHSAPRCNSHEQLEQHLRLQSWQRFSSFSRILFKHVRHDPYFGSLRFTGTAFGAMVALLD